jgi:hypothetical protein
MCMAGFKPSPMISMIVNKAILKIARAIAELKEMRVLSPKPNGRGL